MVPMVTYAQITPIDGLRIKTDNTSYQNLEIELLFDGKPFQTIQLAYKFSNDLTLNQIRDGLEPFVVKYLYTNYG